MEDKEGKRILVTGANGQLGRAIRQEAGKGAYAMCFEYAGSKELDITDPGQVTAYIKNGRFGYCINCAAYTQVDKAEDDPENALKVNGEGPRNLAKACHEHNTVLIHISTDFVFDGKQATPYLETDRPSPLGMYGFSKFKGEQHVVRNMDRYFIVRTSWLYSATGPNFYTSMLKYGRERDHLSVVFDQVGTPTAAQDLAQALLKIIASGKEAFGIYHYSNEGVASWYDFALAIFEANGINAAVRPIRTAAYPLPAARPAYSVLDKHNIKKLLQIPIPHWRESLYKVAQQER